MPSVPKTAPRKTDTAQARFVVAEADDNDPAFDPPTTIVSSTSARPRKNHERAPASTGAVAVAAASITKEAGPSTKDKDKDTFAIEVSYCLLHSY